MFYAKLKKPIYHLKQSEPEHTNFGLGNVEALLRRYNIDKTKSIYNIKTNFTEIVKEFAANQKEPKIASE